MPKEIGLDPSVKVLNLRGEEYPKSLATQKELDSLPVKQTLVQDVNGVFKKADVPDRDKLEAETVGNVILNCLATYVSRDKRDGFYVNLIAQSMISGIQDKTKIVFKEKIMKFLLEVLDESIMRREKVSDKKDGKDVEEKVKGLYAGWVIAQVKKELGVEEEE